jgi:hypothetical protein
MPNSLAFYNMCIGLLCFIYLICSVRINIPFVAIFFSLTVGFGIEAGAGWQLANGK